MPNPEATNPVDQPDPTVVPAKPADVVVPAANEVSSFEEMLKQARIERVFVIDDVFDSPNSAELSQKTVDGFAQDLAEGGLYQEEAKRLGIDTSTGRLSDNNLKALWEYCLSKQKQPTLGVSSAYEFETPLTRFMGTHVAFDDRIRRHYAVRLLCNCLERRNVKVTTLGATAAIPDENVDLIFLDFVLAPAAEIIDQLAIDRLQEFYKKKSSQYVILISDHEGITAEKRTRICREVNTLGGFFGFISKDDISDEAMLFLKLAELGVCMGVNGHQEIRGFANAVADSLTGVTEKLSDFIYRLELQDYVHLQNMRLAQVGEPLGEYIQWLFEAKLGHLFAADTTVAAKRSAVDQLKYKNLLPASSEPSDALSDAFFCAQTEPAATVTGRFPQLGDVYVREKEVRLIITPACDLFVSVDGTSRKPAPNMPVFLLEGMADEKHPHSDRVIPYVTNCFVIDGKAHVITWDIDAGVRSIDYGKLATTLMTDGFVFKAQLRPVFAIAIQRQFAENLCRVGLPTSPPIGLTGQVHLYGGEQTDKLTLLCSPIKSAAHVRQEQSKTLARLSVNGISEIRSKLRKAMQNASGDVTTTDSVTWFKTHADHIEAVLKKEKLWLRLASEFTSGIVGVLNHNQPDVIVGHPSELLKARKTEGAFVISITRESDEPPTPGPAA